jgi:sugar lactone lactonase YvrE
MVRNTLLATFVALLMLASVHSRTEAGDAVDFGSDRWEVKRGEVTTHLGRKCFVGTAYLEDVDFENGVIEVDIAVSGAASYPGVAFRVQSDKDYERFYVRPHRMGRYPDALQYTPVINGIAGWQLYHGKGFTAGADKHENEWVHLRVEIKGSQARVFYGAADKPALVIDELKHGVSRGSIGVMGQNDGSAWFSNFRYRLTDDLAFDAPPAKNTPEGTVTEWELSRAFKTNRINPRTYPRFFAIFAGKWRTVTSEPSGLVDVARYVELRGGGPDCVMARKIVQSDKRRDIKLTFGYSDEVTVFLNGQRVFTGNSAYRSRDRSFMGVVGPHDTVYLTLEKGRNEIMLIVTERFGGWGFMARIDEELQEPAREDGRLVRVWETDEVFKIPESALYDRKRDVLYVSSFYRVKRANANKGFISRVTPDGEIEELEWITGLDGPCGMGIHKNNLYVVECTGNLVEIDIKKSEVKNRYPVEGITFLNDLAIDGKGDVYFSDTSRDKYGPDIYRFRKGEVEVWKTGDEIHRSNGLFVHDKRLIVGNTGDGFLKSVDLEDKRVEKIACLGAGVIDGIRVVDDGVYIVSHWEGQTYLVTPDGDVTQIQDTMGDGLNAADFEYIPEKRLLVVPTFLGNKVVAYRLEEF